MKTACHSRRMKLWVLAPLAGILFTAACSSSPATSTGNSTTTAFPSSLAVASPTELTADTTSSSLNAAALRMHVQSTTTPLIQRYVWATRRIDEILSGSTVTICKDFDPSLFLVRADDAECYGPAVQYEGHPDGAGGSGELPVGDVGMWQATDAETGHACTAAELNARMEGVRSQSFAALTGLASMICTMNLNGISLPSASSVDLTTEMNALGITDTTFNSATISEDGSGRYDYELDLTYQSTPIVVEMAHIPGAADAYQGRLSYRVDDTFNMNCPGGDVTLNGSLLYSRSMLTDMSIEARTAYFCGHGVDGLSSGLVDLTDEYDAATNSDGWTDAADRFVATYDPTTLGGDYSYIWQAGYFDGNARALNLTVNGDEQSATAFYGYADDISEMDATIGGFICNWAGPSPDHTLLDYAQYQTVAYDSTTELFAAGTSNIGYAPVNGCEYNGVGTFSYDSDLDGAVDTDPLVAVPNDLLPLTDVDLDGIFDEIAASGFVDPAAPANF